jgi:UPF0755 protein
MQRQARRRRRILLAAVLGVVFLALVRFWTQFAPASKSHTPTKVDIPQGAGVGDIAERLEQEHIIRSGVAFQVYVRFKGEGKRFRAGQYVLFPDMRLSQVVRALNQGPNGDYDDRPRVTIPEGYTLVQIADLLATKGVVSKEQFLAIVTDPKEIKKLPAAFPLPEENLEGYLFPDTYFFRKNESAVKVVEEMLMNFSTRFYRPYQQEMTNRKRDLHTIVTVAAMVEREAKVADDRARIAGVIFNRLDKKMKLEIDATVLYALGKHKQRVTFADLKVDSPYNTYRVAGLPPGGIANPGLSSLVAALLPETHDYLYYVARPNGEHLFSTNKAEHDRAIKQVQAERQP